MEGAIAKKNVGALKTLIQSPTAAQEINQRFLLHKVIKMADQMGEETPQLVEMFSVLVGTPGVNLNIQQAPPPGTNAFAFAPGTFGTPLQLALSKGLPEIAHTLTKALGLRPQDEIPIVEMSLFQWSILRNKRNLFFRLLEDPDFNAKTEAANIKTLKLAIQSLHPVYFQTMLENWKNMAINEGEGTRENMLTFAIEKDRLAIADHLLDYPGLDLIDSFLKLLGSNMTYTHAEYLKKIAQRLGASDLELLKDEVQLYPVIQRIKPHVIALIDAEIQGRKESMKGFANVVNMRKLPTNILYPIGEFVGIRGGKRMRTNTTKRNKQLTRKNKEKHSKSKSKRSRN